MLSFGGFVSCLEMQHSLLTAFTARTFSVLRNPFPRCVHQTAAKIVQQTDNGARTLTVVTESSDGVRRIQLTNPEKRNCLSLQMIRQLREDFGNSAESTRAVVLSAQGKVFCSGHDLKELTSKHGYEAQQRIFNECTELMLYIRQLPLPVFCQVDGLVAAAGLQLMAMCDIVLATRKSQFSTPGVNFGLFCTTPGVALARQVPPKIAMPMLLTGDPIDAEKALAHGLISEVTDDAAQLEQKTDEMVSSVLGKSRDVVALGKHYFYQQVQDRITQAYEVGCTGMMENLQLEDCQEGLQAFAEKRKPKWKQ